MLAGEKPTFDKKGVETLCNNRVCCLGYLGIVPGNTALELGGYCSQLINILWKHVMLDSGA